MYNTSIKIFALQGIRLSKKYMILGAGCSSAIQTALFLLAQPDVAEIIAVGRAPLRPEHFSLNVSKHIKYKYHALHITYEFDLFMELLDKVQPDIIINFAAQGETAVSWKNTWRFFETNCVTMTHLCEELGKRSWIERFIHVSTAGVYGYADYAVKEDHVLDPSSPYGASKAAFDMYIKSMQKINRLPLNVVRPANIYGPGQLLHKLLPRAAMCGLKGEKLPLHGGGKISKSYLHAQDFANALYLIAKQAPVGKFYNVAPDEPRPLYEIVNFVADELGISFNDLCVTTEDRLLQDGGFWLDCSALKQDTGWRASVSLLDGVMGVVDWAKRYYDTLLLEPMNYTLRG